MTKNNKKSNFIGFILGLLIGNKGIPLIWHIFYITSILILTINYYLKIYP